MRPGRKGPGNYGCSHSPMSRRQRFNEAGAQRPRKLAFRRGAVLPRFGASMRPGRKGPGNGACDATSRRGYSCASMRPGRKGPGNRIGRCPAYSPKSCFNEAGAQRPRKPRRARARRPVERASMRPGRKGPGNGLNSPNRGAGGRPSFNEAGAQRPRKRLRRTRRRGGYASASMRPGRKGPGNDILSIFRIVFVVLQ